MDHSASKETTPEFAGIVDVAVKLAGHRLGPLGDSLYDLGPRRIVDITAGNITFGPFTNSDGNTYTVQGYTAGPGYDLASGLGTVDAVRFVKALAAHRPD